MSERMGSGRDVIHYWRLVEMFTPQKVDKPDPANASNPVDDWMPSRQLPWATNRKGPDDRRGYRWMHTMYLGVYDLDAVYEHLHRAFPDDREAHDEHPLGSSACAAVVVDQNGRLLPDTAVLSSAVWGVGRLRSPGLRDPSWMLGLEDAGEAFWLELLRLMAPAEGDSSPDHPVDAPVVHSLVEAAHTAAGIRDLPGLCSPKVRIASSWVHREADPEPPFLNSFFLADLATVASSALGRALSAYLTMPDELRLADRVDVRRRPEVVVAGTGIGRMPLGRWLSNPQHPLATSQQFAVNEVVNTLGPAG